MSIYDPPEIVNLIVVRIEATELVSINISSQPCEVFGGFGQPV